MPLEKDFSKKGNLSYKLWTKIEGFYRQMSEYIKSG